MFKLFDFVTSVTFKVALILVSSSLYGQCYLNLPEGAPCVGIDGVNGTCVGLYRCYSAALTAVFSKSGYDHGPSELPEVCSYRNDEEPVLCCTDCRLDESELLRDYVVAPGGFLLRRMNSTAWNKCIGYFQELPYPCRGLSYSRTYYLRTLDNSGQCHILVNPSSGRGEASGGGGRDGHRFEYPHMALLGFGEDSDSAEWLCGGSVISEFFILTAAHCTAHPTLGKVSYAALGILRRSDFKDYWKVYRIRRIIPHPEYSSPSKYHDIALLETDTEINFGKAILPACVSPVSYDISYLTAPGWGRLGHNRPLADTLQVLELRVFNESVCGNTFPAHRLLQRGYDHSTQMCCGAADYVKLTDTCEGDSGGPLEDSSFCVHFVRGVTSYGRDCGIPGSAGMYTRVSHYVPWIERVVWPNN